MGQMVAMRLMGVPELRYVGFETLCWWRRLLLRAKSQSIVGTWRRVQRRVQQGAGKGDLRT